MYDYALGGKDNFAADRKLADQLIAIYPVIPQIVRENRRFLHYAVLWAAQQGIGQFVDLGCGMPISPSTHESARAAQPGARVAYVDDDPVVVSHLMAAAAKDPAITVIDADLRDADAIIGSLATGMELARPACLVLGMILQFVELRAGLDLVARYVAALAPGSYVVVSVPVLDDSPDSDKLESLYSAEASQLYRRKAADVASFLTGLDLLPPGVTDARAWRAGWNVVPATPSRGITIMVGVARVPLIGRGGPGATRPWRVPPGSRPG
jgi:trans-aconitate methyltransferase